MSGTAGQKRPLPRDLKRNFLDVLSISGWLQRLGVAERV